MVFNEIEIELLNAAYQTFVGRTHIFDVFSPKKWRDTGIENWVQTEFMAALMDRDYEVTTIGKVKRGCDIIIREEKLGLDVGIEIKAFTFPYYAGLIGGIEGHSNADLYLFLCRFDNQLLKQLDDYFQKHGYIQKYRTFNTWMVMLVKRERISS